jgi:hypothetical protein
LLAPRDVTETARQGQGIGDLEAMWQMATTAIPEVLRNAPVTSTPMSVFDMARAVADRDLPAAGMAALGAIPFAGMLRHADKSQLAMREVLDAADAAWQAYLKRNIPDVVYHGSPNKKLAALDPALAREVRGTTWFSSNPDVADQYVYPREYGEILETATPGRVYPAKLDVNNPYVVDLVERQRQMGTLPSGGRLPVGDAKTMARLVEEAKAANRDALVVKNVDDTIDSSNIPGTSFAIWEPQKATLALKRKK